MGQILIRNLDDRIIETLKRRAEAAGRSMEAEAREALSQLVQDPLARRAAAIAAMQTEFERSRVPGTVMPDSLELLREGRDRDAR
jgi:plasmid stability protein